MLHTVRQMLSARHYAWSVKRRHWHCPQAGDQNAMCHVIYKGQDRQHSET